MKSRHRILSLLAIVISVLALMAGLTGCGSSPASNGNKAATTMPLIRVSHQPEFESFDTYNAIQNGLDKKAGVQFKMVYFDSGMPQIEALPANQWDVGATGCVPAIMAALRYHAYVIGLADDESYANVVMARPNSPVFKHHNSNGTFGLASDVKGMTVFDTTVSSGDYALSGYLSSLGLTEKSVKIENMEQAQAVAAFDSGKGDLVALWAPFMYVGLEKGWKVVSNGAQVGANIPLVLIANKQFADAHPDQVVKFLDVYFQGIDNMKQNGSNLTDQYQAFLKTWGGVQISTKDAALDIKNHPVYTLKEQLAMFDNSKGPSKMQQWLQGVANFFAAQGKFSQQDVTTVMSSNFINNSFMQTLAKQKGISE